MAGAALLAGEGRLQRAFETIDRAFSARTPEELDAIIGAALAEFGVDFFSADQMLDPGGVIAGAHHFGRWPEDWGAHYIDQRHHLHDSVVRHAVTSPTPMHWRNGRMRPDLSAEEKRLFGEAASFGLKDGYVTPLHQTDGAVASVSLTSRERLDLSPADHAALRLLSIYYCSFGLRLKHLQRGGVRTKTLLTTRQRECLQWVRAGKSSWAIGEILGVSERTVNFHIEEACKRLNVQTRQQAVIEAVIQGLISI